MDGQPDVEGRARVTAVEGHRAAVALDDDPPDGVETETRSLPDRLGGVEGLEYVRPGVGRDPRARIGDVDQDALAVAPRPHDDRAAVPDGADRVVEQVGPHLVDL